jgi:hypothetical protein
LRKPEELETKRIHSEVGVGVKEVMMNSCLEDTGEWNWKLHFTSYPKIDFHPFVFTSSEK